MSGVQVPETWMAQSYLPPLCARHGVPSTSSLKRTFYSKPPPWSYLLIFFGVVVFVLVVTLTRAKVTGNVPACVECARERRRFWLMVLAAWIASLAILVLGITFSKAGVTLLGFFAILGAVIVSLLGDRFRVSGNVSKDRIWVNLKGVHETFAAAVNDGVRASTASPVEPSTSAPPSSLPGY